MRFRKALAAIVLSTAVPGVAAAQTAAQSTALGARQVDIAYEITFAGLSGFRIDLTAKFNGSSYDIESRTFKEGILRAVTMHYDGRNRAWGGFSPEGARPAAGSLSIVVGDKPRTWVAQYAGGTIQETHNPAYKPSPQNTISEEQRRGSLDPLSAGLSVGMAGDAACDRTVQSNDGKRRIDVIIKKVGTESAAKSGIPGAQGDVLVCEIFTRRVAGEFDSAPKEAETERERPMRIWLARLDQSQMRYPAKLEAQTGFGTIRGRILSFRERPMTPDESQAMRK
ncbi:hypothetical protein [Reyranella sp.]|uniref:DUF3108 domain-containing protein n=1 Tax=Reyranella sp. TaxID=1929291 RepID=UPI002725CDCA|nr:hypothetical protein [Reyranella sp.]MDO8973861.1 hypothetical protein [Reyranella sp.]